MNKHKNRKLKWLFNLGNIEITPLFLTKKYTFVVNTYQAVVLCLFNKYAELTYAQIKDNGAF